MRKFILALAAFLLLTGTVFAQGPGFTTNLHLLQKVPTEREMGTDTKAMFEGSMITDNSYTYGLFSDDLREGFPFVQLIHEHKFWELSLYGHVEYRAYGFQSSVLYLGTAYNISTGYGIVAVELMYRNGSPQYRNPVLDFRSKNGGQFSLVTDHDWEICNLRTFTDIFVENRQWEWYSEVWLYFPVMDHLEVGGIIYGTVNASGFGYGISLGIEIN